MTDPGISNEIVGVVRRGLESLGFDSKTTPTVAKGMIVPGPAADAMFDRAAADLSDDAIGLTLVPRIPIGSLGPIDYGLITSATLREAMRVVTQYYGVATQRIRLELVERGPSAWLVSHRLPRIAHNRHWIEFALAMIGTRIRQTLDDDRFAFSRVAFQHAPPPRRDAHDTFFGTRVEFSATEDSITFSSEWLDRPLQTASKALAELLERRMSELEPAMSPVDPVLDRVRRTLVVMLDEGLTDITSLASRLGESKRTLQRILSDRSTSHTVLVDQLRRQRATQLLDQGLRVLDVAKRLGFSEPSAFFRAYRRWTGTSPKQTRRG